MPGRSRLLSEGCRYSLSYKGKDLLQLVVGGVVGGREWGGRVVEGAW